MHAVQATQAHTKGHGSKGSMGTSGPPPSGRRISSMVCNMRGQLKTGKSKKDRNKPQNFYRDALVSVLPLQGSPRRSRLRGVVRPVEAKRKIAPLELLWLGRLDLFELPRRVNSGLWS